MPRTKRRQVAPTDEWLQLRLFVSSPEQEFYEALRPIMLFGRSPAVRARETGLAERTLRRKAHVFDEHCAHQAELCIACTVVSYPIFRRVSVIL